MARILNKNGLIAALDIGTSKTCCVLARPLSEERALIVGAGSYQCKGLKSGVIVDLPETVNAVRNAVQNAEEIAEERIETVVVNAVVRQLKSELLQSTLALGGAEVTQGDINRLVSKARDQIPKNDDEILHCIPTDYSLDDTYAIRDPRGLFGETLSLTLHTVMTPPAPIRNMNTVLEQCHLSSSKKIAPPYAAGLACLTEEEKKQGTAVIDMGAGMTGIGVFYEGQLVFATRLPIGGNHVTNDLTIKFKTSFANAERLKTLHGSAYPSQTYLDEEIDVPLLGEDERVSLYRISRMELVNIIIPRIQETFGLIRHQLETNGFYDICLNFVLTGGASQLQGIREMASSVMQKNVRIGQPVSLYDKKNLILEASYPAYMGCIGLLRYALNAQIDAPNPQNDIQKHNSKIKQFFYWFLDNS